MLRKIKNNCRKSIVLVSKIIVALLFKANLLKHNWALKFTRSFTLLLTNQYFIVNILRLYKNSLGSQEERSKFFKRIIFIFFRKGVLLFIKALEIGGENIQIIYHPEERSATYQKLFCKIKPIDEIETEQVAESDDSLVMYSHSLSSNPDIRKLNKVKIQARKIKDVWLAGPYLVIKQNRENMVITNNIITYTSYIDPMDPYTSGYHDLSITRFHDNNIVVGVPKINKLNPSFDEAILFSEKCSSNYFHWIFESMSKIKTIDQLPNAKNIPIIIDSSLPFQHYEMLKLVFDDFEERKFISFSRYSDAIHIQNLIIPEPPIYLSDNWEKADIDRVLIGAEHLKYLVKKILGKINDNLGINSYKRIFLDRSGNHRGLLNRQEVTETLEANGFKIVRPEKMLFEEQVKLFRNAEIIVAPSGAALSNIIFCKPKTKVVVLTSSIHQGDCIFNTIAKIFKLNCSYIGGAIKTPTQETFFRRLLKADMYGLFWAIGGFHINTEELKKHLK